MVMFIAMMIGVWGYGYAVYSAEIKSRRSW